MRRLLLLGGRRARICGARGCTRRREDRDRVAARCAPSGLVHAEPGEPDVERQHRRERRAHALRLDVPQLRPGVLGQDARTPGTTTASRSSTSPTTASRASWSTSRAPARSTTCRSGTTCCSSRSRPAHQRGVRLHAAGARLRGHADLRRLEPARARADQGRADRLRLAHPHARAGHPRTAACCSTSRPTRRASCRQSAYGNACLRVDENGQRHNKISVVEVPLRDPESASVVSEPRFPQNPYRLPGRLERLPRHLRLHGDRARGLGVHGRGPDLGHLRQGEPAHDRARPQPQRRVLPLGHVLVGRQDRDLRRRGRRRHAAALPRGRRDRAAGPGHARRALVLRRR